MTTDWDGNGDDDNEGKYGNSDINGHSHDDDKDDDNSDDYDDEEGNGGHISDHIAFKVFVGRRCCAMFGTFLCLFVKLSRTLAPKNVNAKD